MSYGSRLGSLGSKRGGYGGATGRAPSGLSNLEAMLAHSIWDDDDVIASFLVHEDFITLVGSNVSELIDPKDATRKWVQPTDAKRPTVNVGNRSMSTNGTSNVMNENAALLTSWNTADDNLTVIFIVNADSAAGFILEAHDAGPPVLAIIAESVTISGPNTGMRLRVSRDASGLKAANATDVINDALTFFAGKSERNATVKAKTGANASVAGDMEADLPNAPSFVAVDLFAASIGGGNFYTSADIVAGIIRKGTPPTDALLDNFRGVVNPYLAEIGLTSV